jgi:hypothetical protein
MSTEDNVKTASWTRFAAFTATPIIALGMMGKWLTDMKDSADPYGTSFPDPAVNVDGPLPRTWGVWIWHPFLMMLGFGVLMPAAAISFKVLPLKRETRKAIHASLMTFGWVCATIALSVVVRFKNVAGYPHIYTTHGIFGIVVYGLYTAQYLGGVIAYGLKLPTEGMRASFLPLHVFLGLSTYLAAATTIAVGIFDRQRIAPGQGSPNSSLFRFGGFVVCAHFLGVLGTVWVLGRFSHAEKAGTGRGTTETGADRYSALLDQK